MMLQILLCKDTKIHQKLLYCERLNNGVKYAKTHKKHQNMKKSKFKIEYPLSNASPGILWNSIGTVHGLSEWFADEVNADENQYIFKWDGFEQKANLLHAKPNSYIRFQWEEDNGTEVYFEMKIVTSELSNDLMLYVTDYAEKSEIEDAILLWNKQIDNLKRATGM